MVSTEENIQFLKDWVMIFFGKGWAVYTLTLRGKQ